MGIFSTLNTGVTGLTASQLAISTTGHNISNVHTPNFTRQRLVQSAHDGLHTTPGDIGMGVRVDTVVRIHNEFVFQRLRHSNTQLSNTDYSKQYLQEISKRFPDLKDSGLQRDLANYFKAWNDYASHPEEGAQKVNLVQFAKTLTENLNNTANTLETLRISINDQMKTNVDEANRLIEEIASINKKIQRIEALEPNRANDLRDKRDQAELTLSKIVDFNVFKGTLKTENKINKYLTDQGTAYHLNIGGFSVVDGVNFHPLKMDNSKNQSLFYSMYYERQDGKLIKMDNVVKGGKLGAMYELRGKVIDSDIRNGKPQDGKITEYLDNLNALAKTITVQTNNIYAKSAQDKMSSQDILNLKPDLPLTQFDTSIQRGSFDAVIYNNEGVEIARKTIDINLTTAMEYTQRDANGNYINPNSIVAKFNQNTDDNKDNNSLNDVDDYFKADYTYDDDTGIGTLQFIPKTTQGKFKIAIEDKGTNIPGVIALSTVFQGLDAKHIKVNPELANDPSKLQGFSAPAAGNNVVANQMVQLQYDKVTIYRDDGEKFDESIESFYRFMTTKIASDTEINNKLHETNKAVNKTIFAESQSISGVNMDEELANLMKFQATYAANAKTITTIDKMLDTLLSLKQ